MTKNVTNKKNKRVNSLVLLLLFTAVMLSTATYAWFTANPTVTLDTMEVNVNAVSGLQVSANGFDWKASVTLTDLVNAGVAGPSGVAYSSHVNQLPTVLSPTSSAGDVTGGRLQIFNGTVNPDSGGNFALTANKLNDSAGSGAGAGQYVAFDLFLKTETAEPELSVYLTRNSSVTSTGADRGIRQATRVAFLLPWDSGEDKPLALPAGDTQGNIQGQQPDKAFIWEPNYELHTASGKAAALSRRGINLNTQYVGQPVPYDAVYANITTPGVLLTAADEATNPTRFKNVAPSISTLSNYHTTTGNFVEAFKIAPGITKIRVYMWVEGQDVDCENNASGTNILFNVQFSTDAS